MPKLYTKIRTTNPYGREVIVYRSHDGKTVVELQYPLNGGYWWVKLKTVGGPGNDGALNLPDYACLTVAEIFKDINRENIRLSKWMDR